MGFKIFGDQITGMSGPWITPWNYQRGTAPENRPFDAPKRKAGESIPTTIHFQVFREGKWFGGPTTFEEDVFWVH